MNSTLKKGVYFIGAAIILIVLLFVALPKACHAADVTLTWDTVTGADGYRIYRSADQGATWIEVYDLAAPAVTVTLIGESDTGLLLYRVGAYNAQGETIRLWSGAFHCGDWKPIESPSGTGIE